MSLAMYACHGMHFLPATTACIPNQLWQMIDELDVREELYCRAVKRVAGGRLTMTDDVDCNKPLLDGPSTTVELHSTHASGHDESIAARAQSKRLRTEVRYMKAARYDGMLVMVWGHCLLIYCMNPL